MNKQHSLILLALCILMLCSCELYTKAPDKGLVRMISIGIDYQDTEIWKNSSGTRPTLAGTVGDAKGLSETFRLGAKLSTNRTFADGYPLLMVQEGTTDANRRKEATYPTKEHVLAQLATIAGEAGENDLFILTYSGHGLDKTGEFVFSTTEVSGLTEEKRTASLLSPSELLAAVNKIPGRKLLIIDSCFSGQFLEGQGNDSYLDTTYGKQGFGDVLDQLFSNLPSVQQDKLFIITAARKDESSWEPGWPIKGQHGFFTEGLLSSMGMVSRYETGTSPLVFKDLYFSGSMPAASKYGIGMDDIFSYAASYVNNNCKEDQTPQSIRGIYDLLLFEF